MGGTYLQTRKPVDFTHETRRILHMKQAVNCNYSIIISVFISS